MKTFSNVEKIWPTGCDFHSSILREEVQAREYEGADVPANIMELIRGLHRFEAYPENLLWEMYKYLQELPQRADFHYDQPYDLEEIRAARPRRERRDFRSDVKEDDVLDRIHGGWSLRLAGNVLGIPVESMAASSSGDNGIAAGSPLHGRAVMRSYLEPRGEWPLKDYFEMTDRNLWPKHFWLTDHLPSCRGNVKYAMTDDDTRLTLINLMILEENGPDFQWWQVANFWNSHLPMRQVCTAECQALLNFNMRSGMWVYPPEHVTDFATPEFTSGYNNPYREWVGAVNRADGFGFACAGMPEVAARLAWEDAHWTHRANGIYGEMLIAAAEAAAFVTQDYDEILDIALGEIPENCRLADEVRWMRRTMPAFSDFLSGAEEMDKRYNGMHIVHAVPNVIATLSAVYFAEGDPDRAICNAVMACYDTDSAAATAGGIAGIMAGQRNLKGTLIEPLNDTFESEILNVPKRSSVKSLAERHLAQWRRLAEKA